MAQGLPAQEDVAVGLAALGALCAALSGQASQPAAAPDGREDVRMLLVRCAGPFAEGKLRRAQLRIDRERPKEAQLAALDLPGRLRLEQVVSAESPSSAATLIVREQKAWWSSDGKEVKPAEGEALLLAERWRSFLRAVCLEPLTACQRATRQGPTVLSLHLEGGETWHLDYDPDKKLPVRLIGPECDVAFVSFTALATTNMPARVRSKELGEREIRFENVDMRFDDLVFQDFGTRVGALRNKPPDRTVGREVRPKKPTLQQVRSDLLLVVDDPGGWPERIKLVLQEMKRLTELGQASAGLPFLFTEKGAARIGIPFLPDEERGSPPFADKGDRRVVRRTTHAVLALHLVGTSVETAVAEGGAQLGAAAKERGLTAAGPLRAIPYVYEFSGAVKKTADFAKLDVRLELPIE